MMMPPKIAPEASESTEYFNNAGNEVNGFQTAAVVNSSKTQTIKTVQRAQGFNIICFALLLLHISAEWEFGRLRIVLVLDFGSKNHWSGFLIYVDFADEAVVAGLN